MAKDAGVTKKMSLKNASRHYKTTVKKHAFAMPIRISTYVHVEDGETASVSVSWLRPSDVLRHLLTKYPALVLGGCATDDAAEAMLETFWAQYERNHPTHHVFMDRNALRRTIPMCLHGDGARSQKKLPLEVISIESALGLNSGDCIDCHCDICNCPTRKRDRAGEFCNPMIQKLNSKHNSYLSKYLLVAFPSKEYKPGLLKALLGAISIDIAQIGRYGVSTPGGIWRIAILGYKGDMEYHSKLDLARCYANVGHVNPKPCCHECMAGAAAYPFEDSNTDAAWKATRSTSMPWRLPPPFTPIAFEDWFSNTEGRASMFFPTRPFPHIQAGGLQELYWIMYPNAGIPRFL